MAAVEFFVKLDGIDGESQDDVHENEIHVDSFTFGVTNAGATGVNLGLGAAKLQDFHFTKSTDKASSKLFVACCTGQHIPTATITVRKGGEKPMEYLVIKLTEILVSSYNTSGAGSGVVQESFSLHFSKIEMNYSSQNADGSAGAKITESYDLKLNKAS
jgi:type VI secretion system secreted protein Hcp